MTDALKPVKRIALPALIVALGALFFTWANSAVADDNVVKPNSNLVVDGIPPIPEVLTQKMERYTELRSATFSDWHPSRKEMLISTRFGNTNQIHLVSAPGAARQQLTFFKEPVSNAWFHPHGGDYVVFQKDVGGGEWNQLYRFDLKTSESTLLTDGKSRNSALVWSTRGDQIAYTSTRRTGADNDVWLMDPAHPETNHLLAQLKGGGWCVSDWSVDGKQIAMIEAVSVNESYVWLIDAASGEKKELFERVAGQQIACDHPQFSRDGKGLYFLTDNNSEYARLAYVELATKKTRVLSAKINWNVESFSLSADGKKIAYLSNEDGISKLHLLDTASGKDDTVAGLQKGVISALRWHNNSRDLAFDNGSSSALRDVYSFNVTSGKITRWTKSESAVNLADLPDDKVIHWKSFDGLEISGIEISPPAKFTGKRPVLISIHGGPEGQSRPVISSLSSYLVNELGIAVIRPNIRGSTGYGKTYTKLDNGFLRQDSYKDIDALFDWIAQQPDLDAHHVAVMGGSYGGHMTLAISAFYPERLNCSVDIVGMSNLVTFLEHTEAYRRDLRRVEYGDERDPKMREFLEKIAPMNNIEKISKPMFVIAGKNDPRVPVSESDQIVDALKKQGTVVWYLKANDEGHGFKKKENTDFQNYATSLFLQDCLLK